MTHVPQVLTFSATSTPVWNLLTAHPLCFHLRSVLSQLPLPFSTRGTKQTSGNVNELCPSAQGLSGVVAGSAGTVLAALVGVHATQSQSQSLQ